MREESLRTAAQGAPFRVQFYASLSVWSVFIFKLHFIS
jgi:hypothetical protein